MLVCLQEVGLFGGKGLAYILRVNASRLATLQVFSQHVALRLNENYLYVRVYTSDHR